MKAQCIVTLIICFLILSSILFGCSNTLKPAEFTVNNIDINPKEVAPFEKVTVTAVIQNTGGIADNYTAVLYVDGKEKDRQITSIAASENITINFSINESNLGSHEVQIGACKATFQTYKTASTLLRHDNGDDTYTFMTWGQVGQWTSFSPPSTPFKINKILIKGYLWNVTDAEKRSYTLKIWNGLFERQLFSSDYSYTNFSKDKQTIEHAINPPVIVSGDFIIDFISNGIKTEGNKYSSIPICVDYTVNDNKNIGFSASGSDNITVFSDAKKQQSAFNRASWIIQAEGECRLEQKQAKTGQQNAVLQGIPATLRYDYANSDENLYEQIAIWHSYGRLTSDVPWSTVVGRDIKAPVIILPRKEGFVTIVKGITEGYQFMPLGYTSYKQTYDDKYLLNLPGWGLATNFHPENTPFQILTIKMACVANYTEGILTDYDNKYVKIQILNKESQIIWSEFFPWSKFRGSIVKTIDALPSTFWIDIPTGGVTVNGDFTVEVRSMGKSYIKESRGYDYFAIAYERIEDCGKAKTNSFISENGAISDPWITLYDRIGRPVCFNLCIRVDGIY